MATDAQVKAGLSFGTNHFGISAKTINDAQLARIKAWFTASYPTELGGETVTSEDIACWLWRQVRGAVNQYENRARDAANDAAAVADLTA
jgi:hypothetical protein